MKEHALQVAVAHMLHVVLDPERTWWSAIDHGAGKLSKASAGMMKARGVKPGLPDFIVMWMSHHLSGEMIGIELKTDHGRLSASQEEIAERWGGLGFSVYVARSLEEVQEILEFMHIPTRTRMTIFPKVKVPYGHRRYVTTSRHS